MKIKLRLPIAFFILVLGMSAIGQFNAYSSYPTSIGDALTTGNFTNLLGTELDDFSLVTANIGFKFRINGVVTLNSL